ncbi:hypothetical protein [Bradyrhizobium cenepequi]|uniref:hypothetical protein n=1 Tax=Bradyrhizobium cenepequi TaxID=2821403 RepID=UPI001CE38575|nr:hypothetical protein [Bradyrhizobium cenepequi]MCA6108060.1 hypothetical protein [Bradyrhizobium cenepequi]
MPALFQIPFDALRGLGFSWSQARGPGERVFSSERRSQPIFDRCQVASSRWAAGIAGGPDSEAGGVGAGGAAAAMMLVMMIVVMPTMA